MKEFTYSEALVLRPETTTDSPLNVPGLKLALTRDDIVSLVHEGRRPVEAPRNNMVQQPGGPWCALVDRVRP